MVLNKGPHIDVLDNIEKKKKKEERSPGSIGSTAKHAKKLSSHLGLRLRETLVNPGSLPPRCPLDGILIRFHWLVQATHIDTIQLAYIWVEGGGGI